MVWHRAGCCCRQSLLLWQSLGAISWPHEYVKGDTLLQRYRLTMPPFYEYAGVRARAPWVVRSGAEQPLCSTYPHDDTAQVGVLPFFTISGIGPLIQTRDFEIETNLPVHVGLGLMMGASTYAIWVDGVKRYDGGVVPIVSDVNCTMPYWPDPWRYFVTTLAPGQTIRIQMLVYRPTDNYGEGSELYFWYNSASPPANWLLGFNPRVWNH